MKKQSKPPNIRHTSRKITCHYPTSKTKLLNSATEIGKIKKIQSQKEMRHSLNDTAWEIVWESSGSQPISLGYRSTQVFMRNTFLASFSSSSNWFLSIWILYWSWIVFSLMCSANLSASVISSWNQTQNQKKIYFTAGQSFPQNTLSHWKSIQKETELCSKAGWPWHSSTTAQAQPAVWWGNFFPSLLFIPAVAANTPHLSQAFVSLPFEASGYSSGCPASLEAPLKSWNFSAPFNYRTWKAWLVWSSLQSKKKILISL